MSTNPIAISGNQSPKTMSSLEIAELTGKQHKHVMADIRKVLEEAEIDSAEFSAQYKDPTGRMLPCFNLPRRECDLVIAGYSVKYRLAIIDRWQELEAQLAQPFQLPDFTNPAIAARAWADEHEQKCFAQQQLAIAQATLEAEQPKIEFAVSIRRIDGTCSVEELAKAIGMGQNKCFKRLRELKILMANGLPYQKYIDKGYLDAAEGKPYTDSKGVKHPTFQTRITGKGQVYLEKKLRPYVQNGLIQIKAGA